MDEMYVRIKGQWIYLYRAVDKAGHTVDFLLTSTRDRAAAWPFCARRFGNTGARRRSRLTRGAAIPLNSAVQPSPPHGDCHPPVQVSQ